MPEKYSKILLAIRLLYQSKRFDEALSLIEKNGEGFLSPQVLVLKGKCIQLAADTTHPLIDAKKAFQSAIELDETYADAWIELGYYVLCVEDNAKEACKIFEKAGQILSGCRDEILQGYKQCMEEF